MSEEEGRRVPIPEAMKLAAEMHESGDLVNAERYYRAILDAEPNNAGATYNLALVRLQTGRAAEALPVLKEALDQDPRQASYWMNYAVALVGIERLDDARAVLIEARGRGLGGQALTAALQKVEARLSDSGAAVVDPSRLGAGEADELIGLHREGRLDELQARAEQLVARRPLAAIAWYFLGAARLDLGLYETAVPAVERARELIPDSPMVLNLLGLAYRRAERNEEARAVFEEGLALAPESFEMLLNASANAVTLDDPDAARHYAERAGRLRPDAPESLRVLADAAAAAGDAEEAAQLYARLAEMQAPPTPGGH